MDHAYFLLINLIVFLVIAFVDRKRYMHYVLLGLVGLVLAFVFENLTTYLGFWYYLSEPKALFFSIYTWLLYIPYLGFCYFAASKVRRYV